MPCAFSRGAIKRFETGLIIPATDRPCLQRFDSTAIVNRFSRKNERGSEKEKEKKRKKAKEEKQRMIGIREKWKEMRQVGEGSPRIDTSGRGISSINFRLSPVRRCLARDILLP